MKKCLLSMLVLSALLISPAVASEVLVLKVKVRSANVRTEPDLNAPVIRTFPLDTLLEAEEKAGDWYKISIDDGRGNQVTGYINAKVVEVLKNAEPDKLQPPAEPVEAAPEPPPAPAPAPVYQRTQEYGSPKAYSGGGIRLLGGMTSSNITYDKARFDELQGGQDLEKFIKSRTGFMGGIGFETGSRISIETDFLYMPKGVKFEGEIDATAEGFGKYKISTDVVANQISVPVLVKFKLLKGSTPFIFAGGEAAYILSSKVVYSYTTNGVTTKGEEDLLKKDENGEVNLNRFDYGAVFGAGFELNLAGLRFSIEGRYHLGMANLFKTSKATAGTPAEDDDYVRSKAIVVLAGIKF